MNKSELVALVATKTGTSKLKTAEVVEAVIESITDAVANNEPVALLGFGTFTLRERAARTGRNPRTGVGTHSKLDYWRLKLD